MSGRLMVNLKGGDQVSYYAYSAIGGDLEELLKTNPRAVHELFRKCFYKNEYELDQSTKSTLRSCHLIDAHGNASEDTMKVVLSSIKRPDNFNFIDLDSSLKFVNVITSQSVEAYEGYTPVLER